MARQRYAPFAVQHLPARDGHTKLAGTKAERIQMCDQRRLRHNAGATAGKLAGHPLVNSASQPRRRSISAAKSPLIEPPMTSARLCAMPTPCYFGSS